MPRTPFRTRAALVVTAGLTVFVASASAAPAVPFGGACRSLDQMGATHVFDYNDPAYASQLKLVETYHFNNDVRSLTRGESSTVQSDLDFVLRAVPNHYEALSLMGRWQLLHGKQNGEPGKYEPAQCYFERAIQFRPNDARVHLVYAVYLHQSRQLEAAEREYSKAEQLGGENAELYYNFGLLLVDMGDITRARAYADKAYALGYPLQGLRNKLRKYPAQ